MASGSDKPQTGSILEPFTRFAVLTAEEQAWLEEYSYNPGLPIKNGVAYRIPATEANLAMADQIGTKLPIRRRWRRVSSKFGHDWDTRKDRATHFNLTCRFEEEAKRG